MTNSVDPTQQPFWRQKTLAELSQDQWESLCDGCAKCCLVKLIDEDDESLHFTNVSCHLLDCESCRCTDYDRRQAIVPDCVILTPKLLDDLSWMPSTCAYRLVYEGKDLPEWHHLICGDKEMVHKAGISARGKVISETEVDDADLTSHIVDWPT